ncbi:MAG: rRNA maturation RNase YbeY [Ignavibacteria bacterium]
MNNAISLAPNNSWIFIHNFHPSLKPPINKELIKITVNNVFKGENKILNELCLNLVTDGEIRAINKRYLKHNYSTDIITFDYGSKNHKVEGEIFISLENIKANSQYYKTSYGQEFKRVLIHGCLHLSGYKDDTKARRELISNKENFYLKT